MSLPNIVCNRYATSDIEEISGYAVVNFMKHKTRALQAFKEYFVPIDRLDFCELIMGQNAKACD